MPDDLTTAIAKEVAKQIPVRTVYEDALQPGARQSGQIVEDIAKTLHLALAPLQLTAALQDRFRDFLDTSVRRVPEDRRVPPAPQILGPVVEGIKYEPQGSPIEAMFSELLSRSMDKERVDEAHPAFPLLIKQLSHDEAVIILKLHSTQPGHYKRTTRYKVSRGRASFEEVENDTFPSADLVFSSNLDFYMSHLWFLGLAGTFEHAPQYPIKAGDLHIGTREFREYRLTDLGKRFAEAVLPRSVDSAVR